jgi:hypothetical protein
LQNIAKNVEWKDDALFSLADLEDYVKVKLSPERYLRYKNYFTSIGLLVDLWCYYSVSHVPGADNSAGNEVEHLWLKTGMGLCKTTLANVAAFKMSLRAERSRNRREVRLAYDEQHAFTNTRASNTMSRTLERVMTAYAFRMQELQYEQFQEFRSCSLGSFYLPTDDAPSSGSAKHANGNPFRCVHVFLVAHTHQDLSQERITRWNKLQKTDETEETEEIVLSNAAEEKGLADILKHKPLWPLFSKPRVCWMYEDGYTVVLQMPCCCPCLPSCSLCCSLFLLLLKFFNSYLLQCYLQDNVLLLWTLGKGRHCLSSSSSSDKWDLAIVCCAHSIYKSSRCWYCRGHENIMQKTI